MTAPNDVRVGDKVRISYIYEGEVEDTATDWIFLPGRMHNITRAVGTDGGGLHAVTVEVLERAAPKVGDVVKGTELDQLPEFSVVVAVGSTSVQQKTPGGKWWRVGVSGIEIVYPTLDYRVLYVPEDGAE